MRICLFIEINSHENMNINMLENRLNRQKQ